MTLKRAWFLVDSTVRTRFNTGIQRVSRALARSTIEAGVETGFMKWDIETRTFAGLSEAECDHLAKWNGPVARPSSGEAPDVRAGDWIIVPDILLAPGPGPAEVLRAARMRGARVAIIIYDLIPLKLSPKWNERRTEAIHTAADAEAYEVFWKEAAQADAILPISHSVASDFREYIRRSTFRLANLDRKITPVLLGADFGKQPRSAKPVESGVFTVLNVGTIEPRKNQITLIHAFQAAADRPSAPPMRLIVAGSDRVRPDYAATVKQAAGGDARIQFVTDAGDDRLFGIYGEAHLVCSSSYEEGFCLPLVEALWLGRPCLAHNQGALAEVAQDGGVLTLDMLDQSRLADTLADLAQDPDRLRDLAAAARARPVRAWRDYAKDVLSVLASPEPAATSAVRAGEPLLSMCVVAAEGSSSAMRGLDQVRKLSAGYNGAIEVLAGGAGLADAAIRLNGSAPVEIVRGVNATGWREAALALAQRARGRHVWMLDGDAVLLEGAIEDVLETLLDQPDIEVIALNHAQMNAVADAENIDALIASSISVAPETQGHSRMRVKDLAACDPDALSVSSACIVRRDVATAALSIDAAPESKRDTIAFDASPIAAACFDRLAYGAGAWIGRAGVVGPSRSADAEWRLSQFPALLDLAELRGADPEVIDRRRAENLAGAHVLLERLFGAGNTGTFRIERFIEQHLHIDDFRARVLGPALALHKAAHMAGRLPNDGPSPDELTAMFCLRKV